MPFDPLAWLDAELEDLRARRLLRETRARQGPQAAVCRWDGVELVNFGANDYLDLAADPRLAQAAAAALRGEPPESVPQNLDQPPIHPPSASRGDAPSPCAWAGLGAGASPLVTGRGAWHARLELALAEFEHAEAALLFTSGYAANVGVLTALAGKGDVIFSDAKNHASIIDGCRLSGARVQVFPHRDARYLDMMLRQAGGFRRRLIVTDTLFSMDGDLAALPTLADLAERHQAMLIVDEAHATGVFGPGGGGACEFFGVTGRAAARVGTLSKALGVHGGFVVGSRPLIQYLANRARPYVFSTAAPECLAAAALAALAIARNEPVRRENLLRRAGETRAALREQGWNVGDSESQIIPVVLGDPGRALDAAALLRAQGMFVPAIRPPSVPEGESLLRVSLTAGHTPEMLARLLAAFERLPR